MGDTNSKLNEAESILKNPITGEASEFYWACRNGNVDRVKELLSTMSFKELSRLEPNGSTGLHAASYCGHTEIVRLLLHVRGCRRDQRNRYGLTAYEEAYSDEIRQLFQRPEGAQNRFCEEEYDESNTFEVHNNEDNTPNDDWIEGLKSQKDLKEYQEKLNNMFRFSNGIFWKSLLFLSKSNVLQFIIDALDGDKSEPLPPNLCFHSFMKGVNEIITNDVTDQNPSFDQCNALMNDYITNGRADHLLRLYTLETPFYKVLRKRPDELAAPVLLSLDQFRQRFFQGESYRGLLMSQEDLKAYRWSLKHNGVIAVKTFCSSSLKRNKAEGFASGLTADDSRQAVLMILQFKYKCCTAINLCKLSDELPCISVYEDEAEVLILPCTLFRVTNMEKSGRLEIIHLENIHEESNSIFSTIKHFYDNWNKSKSS